LPRETERSFRRRVDARERVKDDVLLRILALHTAGHTAKTIAAVFGQTTQSVAQKIAKVRKDDIAHDSDAARWWATAAQGAKT
jgi:hypothetical protein